jgi:glycosyltransferase involved in cell wall biosynthesis
MTIAIYIESYISGGMDTVIVNKIKNWPTKTRFIIFYNKDYEEVKLILIKELKKFKVTFVNINIFSTEKIYKSLDSKWLVFLTRISSVVLRYLFFILNLLKIIKIFKKYNINHIFIHNGGYPGALSTVPCAVGFYMVTKKKSNYVIHSLPYKISFVNFIYEYLSDRLVSYFCKIIFVSKFSCKLMNLRRYINFQSKIILNGAEIKNFKIKRKNLLTTNFFFSGRICEEKGILFILKNFENLYLNKKIKFKLFICGKISKNIFKQFKFYIDASPIKDKIIYLGFVNNERIQYQLSKVDYLILPSLNIENLSMSAIEAFSVGTPIIASNLESIRELVGSNKCNLLFKSGSDLDFKKKILKIINESSKLRLIKRKKVKFFFLNKFSAKNMSKEYFKLTY